MPLGYSHSSAKLITQLMDARKNGSLGKWSKILWLACRAVISRAVISRRVADISKKKRLHRCTPPYSVLKSSLGPIFNFQVFFGGKTSPEQFWSYSNYLPWGVLIGGIFWWSLAEVSPSPSPNLTLRRKFENDRWLGFIRYGFALKWWVYDAISMGSLAVSAPEAPKLLAWMIRL